MSGVCEELFLISHRSPEKHMTRKRTGNQAEYLLSQTIKVQCNSHHPDTGRGSSSTAEGALPYDVVHLAGGGVRSTRNP